MDRLFRIDFYPQDWLIDTSRLTPDERGVFIQIVCLIYSNRGPIESDPNWIAGVCGCSSRMAKNLVDNLVDKSFLQVTSDLRITQKRAEKELELARVRHENSAKGGRNKAEKDAQSNNPNPLDSSDAPPSLAAPSQPHPISPIKALSPVPVTARDGAGASKDFSGGAERRFSIESLLSDDARSKAKEASRALNRDFFTLCQTYDEGVNSGSRPAPDKPSAAFLKWIPAYTKNERL